MIEINIEKHIKTYHGVLQLKVDTTFNAQQITRVLGPSGSGKTTLLKMLAGLITPDKGTIAVGAEQWFNSDRAYAKKVQERQVGFVFQDYALFPNMTVEKHLQYGTQNLSYITQLLEIAEMTRYRHHLPRQLSGGQQQRLALLRALSTQPSLLLMDEPFSAMDAELKSRVISNLKGLFAAQKTTVIVVTHAEEELDEAAIFRLKSFDEEE